MMIFNSDFLFKFLLVLIKNILKKNHKIETKLQQIFKNYKSVHFLKRELFLMLLTYGVNKKK